MESLSPTLARRFGLAAVLVSALAVPAASEASSTASLDLATNTVTVSSAAGENNNIYLVDSKMPQTNAAAVRISDQTASAVAGLGCQASGANVYCPKPSKVVVNLGDGNDVLGPAGNFSVSIQGNGGDGDDALYGGAANDALAGGAGTDTLGDARGGDDVFSGGDGKDTVTYQDYTANVDVTIGDGANDGGTVSDEADDVQADVENLIGGNGLDTLVGGARNETLDGGPGRDDVSGGAGNDVLVVSAGGDTLKGGVGDDSFEMSPANVNVSTTFRGGEGADLLAYSGVSDDLDISLDDVANDGLAGGTDDVGSDIEEIHGGKGNDRIAGGAGNETLIGNSGDDILTGGDGDDVIDGGAGADQLRGQGGMDTVTYAGRTEGVTVALDALANDGATDEGDKVLSAETIIGSKGDDVLQGGTAAETLNGMAGNDRIDGGSGADTLLGGAGDDAIATRDGIGDSVDCGDGLADSAVADRSDTVVGCESLDLPALPVDEQPVDQGGTPQDAAPADATVAQDAPADASTDSSTATESASSSTVVATTAPAAKTAPAATVATKAGRIAVRGGKLKVRGGKVAVPVTCAKGGARCAGKVTLTMGRKVLGHATFNLAPGSAGKVTVKLSKASRKALRGSKTVNVLAVTNGSAGDLGVARVTRRIA